MQIGGNFQVQVTLSLEQIQVTLALLSKGPFEQVAGIINALQQQAGNAVKVAQEAHAAEEAAKQNMPTTEQ